MNLTIPAVGNFLSLIKEEDIDPHLKQLEEAFSIENVTKEFFEEYNKLFHKLQESLEQVIENDEIIRTEFRQKSIPPADFAKKLMGQIVFIYFLQKKGWLGVDKGEKWGNGPRNFLRKLFNKEMVDYENFFNDILEPLFYEALATQEMMIIIDTLIVRFHFLMEAFLSLLMIMIGFKLKSLLKIKSLKIF